MLIQSFAILLVFMAFSAVSDGAPGRHLLRSYFPLEGYRAEKRGR